MLDLNAPIVPGLATRLSFITVAEEAELIARIDGDQLSPFRFRHWTGKRLTRSYGWSDDFERGSFAPTAPIPDWLEPLKARAARLTRIAQSVRREAPSQAWQALDHRRRGPLGVIGAEDDVADHEFVNA